MQNFALATVFFLSSLGLGLGKDAQAPSEGAIEVTPWGNLPDGRAVTLFRLENSDGMAVTLSNYGALLVSVELPGEDGSRSDVTLSYKNLDEALAGGVNGSVIGRFANRIDGGGFTIDGKRYDLESVNPKTNIHIHGGKTGFHRQLWNAKPSGQPRGKYWVEFSLTSPSGHEGYPGKANVSIRYTLTDKNVLRLEYEGKTSAPTHLNLTNHVYFNLAGSGTVLDQILQMSTQEYLEVDPGKIPTGKLVPVTGTPFDFSQPKPIGRDIEHVSGGGYDHCFVIPNFLPEGNPRTFATLSDPASGRKLEVATTLPGVQIYTANHFKGNPYPKWGGICFETQFYPDTPNKPQFPSSLLRPGETYRHTTEFRFEWE